jgi:two-component system sensor kinase
MNRKTKKMAPGLIVVLITCIFVVGTSTAQVGEKRSTILTAEKTSETITIDGYANETSWAAAKTLIVPVQDGTIGATEVTLQALYDNTYIYILITWNDTTESRINHMWTYDADKGTWSQHGNREDRLSFVWNIEDSITFFNIGGCQVTCHGDRHYTNAADEKGDWWHWKAARTDPVGYADDQWMGNEVKEGKDYESRKVDRHNDNSTTGGYWNNKQTIILPNGSNITIPMYYEPHPTDELDARFLYQWEIDNGEAVLITNQTFKNGTVTPGQILLRPDGSQGDIDGKGVWQNGKWTVELRRKLDTGHDDDVQFDTTKLYRFGFAVFDDTGPFDGYGTGHSFDVGARTLEFGGIGSEEITQLVLIRDYLTAAKAYISRGELGLAISEIDYALALYNEIRDVIADKDPELYMDIKNKFVGSKRDPSLYNINALIGDVDSVILTLQGKREPKEASWALKLAVAWGKIQLYVFIFLAFFAMYPLYKTVQVGRGPELRRMSIFLAIAIAPMVFEGIGRIGIRTKIYFLQNFSFMTNEYATLLWAMWMFMALLIARSGFREVTSTIQSLKTLSTKLEQKVKERTEELESFAYSVSHDLKAPLRGIDGFSSVLLEDYEDKLDDTGKHYLRRIGASSKNMGVLIDDLLQYSRIGRISYPRKNVNASEIVEQVLKELRYQLDEKNIELVVQEDLPTVYCNKDRIAEVFTNLISNSIKFIGDKENPKIEIGCEDKGDHYEFYVRDSGIGFDMKYHDKIFEIFQRLHPPEEYKGTGVGLAIVKKIIERHDGKIWAESKEGVGSTFYFTIPKGGK